MKKYIVIALLLVMNGFMAAAQNLPDSMLAFFKNNPVRTSLVLLENDSIVAAWNPKAALPVAGMADLLVSFEFAKQAAYGVFDTSEKVYTADIEKYYLPGTDEGAFNTWLGTMRSEKRLQNGQVTMMDITRGMMQFGSLAHTDYLLDRLGFDNIKSSIQSLQLNDHSSIVSPMGSLLLYQNPRNIPPKKIMKEIDKMNEEEYCKAAYLFHRALKYDTTIKKKFKKGSMDARMMQSWSDRLPNSNTATYAGFLQSLLAEKTFDPAIYAILRRVLEWPLQYPAVQAMFNRFTMKGSATPVCFTQAQYGIDKNNNRFILVYICDELKPAEFGQLARWHQQFEMQVFTNADMRAKMQRVLGVAK